MCQNAWVGFITCFVEGKDAWSKIGSVKQSLKVRTKQKRTERRCNCANTSAQSSFFLLREFGHSTDEG